MSASSSMRHREYQSFSTGRRACPIALLGCGMVLISCSGATSSFSPSPARRSIAIRDCTVNHSSRSCAVLPGDSVTVSGRQVAINGEDVGAAKTKAYDRRPLAPIAPTVIPPRHYYVQGTSPDSFDSRYQDSGLVRAEQVVGVVVPLY